MADTFLDHLRGLLDEASAGLRGVMPRRMFGCHALFANGQIYGLIWKEGRIGVRLPDPELFADAMELPGSDRWAPGAMAMAHWVLLPEELHDDPEALGRWVRHAHALATSGVGATPRKVAVKMGPVKRPAEKAAAKPAEKKPTAKKPATKKAATKKAATKKAAAKPAARPTKKAAAKPAEKKAAAKPAAKAAKKPAAKGAAKKPAKKATSKPAAKAVAKKPAAKAAKKPTAKTAKKPAAKRPAKRR